MNNIDLVIVVPKCGCGKEICYAPCCILEPGMTVITDFGEGIVEETLFIDPNQYIYQFFSRNMRIRPVLSIVKDIKYQKDDS